MPFYVTLEYGQQFVPKKNSKGYVLNLPLMLELIFPVICSGLPRLFGMLSLSRPKKYCLELDLA